jgi:hypothetical protein
MVNLAEGLRHIAFNVENTHNGWGQKQHNSEIVAG